jgi:uridine kinase
MNRAALLERLAGEIIARKRSDRPLKVGIDGRCAAGKTMLADELGSVLGARCLTVLRPSVDGFHHPRGHRYRQGEFSARGYYEDAFDYDALVEGLLAPLSENKFPVLCRQVSFDLRVELPAEAPLVSVDANTILLFDGIFVFRSRIDAYWDYRILVDVDAEQSLARALGRDADPMNPAELIRKKYQQRYEPAWQMYAGAENPGSKADVVIDNRDVANPQILKGG